LFPNKADRTRRDTFAQRIRNTFGLGGRANQKRQTFVLSPNPDPNAYLPYINFYTVNKTSSPPEYTTNTTSAPSTYAPTTTPVPIPSTPSYTPLTDPPARIVYRKFGYVCEETISEDYCVIGKECDQNGQPLRRWVHILFSNSLNKGGISEPGSEVDFMLGS
jgi:hypothetical protein